jgi:hypothetical protein
VKIIYFRGDVNLPQSELSGRLRSKYTKRPLNHLMTDSFLSGHFDAKKDNFTKYERMKDSGK